MTCFHCLLEIQIYSLRLMNDFGICKTLYNRINEFVCIHYFQFIQAAVPHTIGKTRKNRVIITSRHPFSIQSIPFCIFHDINTHKNNILHKDKSHKTSIHCRIQLHPFHSSSSPPIVSRLPTRKLASNEFSIQTSVDYIECPKQPARMISMVCFGGN